MILKVGGVLGVFTGPTIKALARLPPRRGSSADLNADPLESDLADLVLQGLLQQPPEIPYPYCVYTFKNAVVRVSSAGQS